MLRFLLASTITIYEWKALNYMTKHWESGEKKKLAYVRVEKQHGDKVSVVRAEFRGVERKFQMSVGGLKFVSIRR
jgi:hypothetical protein